MRVAVPLVGIVVAAGVPLVRYAAMERHEQTAIATVRDVIEAQRTYRERSGGFASDVSGLTTVCDASTPVLANDVLTALSSAGYNLELRAAQRAAVIGRDCHGRALVSDFYVAASPRTPSGAARQAFAALSDGRVYLFVDGIAPREHDIESGLPIPLDARESFRIP